jgi:hypothetical protein
VRTSCGCGTISPSWRLNREISCDSTCDADSEGSQFVHRLEQRLRSAASAWEAIAQGAPRYRDVEFVVSAAHGQATTLAFVRLSLLLVEVLEVVRRAEARGRVTTEQYNAVAAAVRFAVQVSAAPPYDADCDVTAIVARLKSSRE